MQCASCQFENMPGSAACGRCGTSMALAQFDVHPPRARAAVKRLRRLSGGLPILRWPAMFRRAPHRISTAPAWMQNLTAPLLWRLMVPGLAHFHLSQRRRGSWFLGIYLAFFLGALVMVGTSAQNMLLGLAFSTHASEVMDILLPMLGATSVARRLAYSVGCMGFLFLAVYYPLGWLVTHVASPLRIQLDSPPFVEGDAVFVNRWAFLRSGPTRGQVVLYDLPEWWAETAGPGHERMRYLYNGQRVDRIVAMADDRVRIDDGKVFINDQSTNVLPLNPGNMPRHLSITVPQGECLIIPSGSRAPIEDEGWTVLSCVPVSQIHGVVYLRAPLTRLMIIR